MEKWKCANFFASLYFSFHAVYYF